MGCRKLLHRGVRLLIVAAFLCVPVQADAYIYTANDSPSGIARAELGGTGANNNFLAANGPAGVAVDSQHIYWANTAANAIGRANLDGTNVNQAFIQLSGGIGLGGVAVDSGHIYWTEANGGGAGQGDIGRANLDGSSPTVSFISGLNNPAGVAVTPSRIYWSNNNGGGSLGDAVLNGNSVTSVTNSFVTAGTGTVASPVGLAADGSFLYWANDEPAGGGSIGRVGLTGVAPTEIVTALSSPAGVAVDGAHLYWTSTSDNAIGRANLDGSSAVPSFITGAKQPNGIAVDGLATPPPAAIPLSPPALNGTNGSHVNHLNPEPKLSAQFSTRRGSTLVTSMRISDVPGQAKVTVACSGKGCPFVSLTPVVRKGKHAITNLASLFHGHALQPGVKVTVTVTQAHETGRRWVFATHGGGKRPTEKASFPNP